MVSETFDLSQTLSDLFSWVTISVISFFCLFLVSETVQNLFFFRFECFFLIQTVASDMAVKYPTSSVFQTVYLCDVWMFKCLGGKGLVAYKIIVSN